MSSSSILVTGGSGLLGSSIKALLPTAKFPTSSEFDVVDKAQIENFLDLNSIDTVLHAAAFTSPPAVDADPTRALDVNIIGTANLVSACFKRSIRLVYISTDYVFDGSKGNYSEEEAVYPVNKYAWSKLGGECAVRMYHNSLIVRTSFGPDEFPYEKAFVDQWTSRETVSNIAEKIMKLVGQPDLVGTIHIGAPRRTVMEFARATSPEKAIEELRTSEVSFSVPKDTSLDCSKYSELV